MFRALALGALLLTGCSAKTETSPRVVKVFDSIAVPMARTKEGDPCKWVKQSISVFGQRAQTLSFEYRQCPIYGAMEISVKDGHDIFVSKFYSAPYLLHEDDKAAMEHLLSIWKIGPLSDEDFVTSLIPDTAQAEHNCRAIKDDDGWWTIGIDEAVKPNNDFAEGWVLYPPLISHYADPEGVCGQYGHSLENKTIIGIKDGIAIGLNDEFANNVQIDISTITYENKG